MGGLGALRVAVTLGLTALAAGAGLGNARSGYAHPGRARDVAGHGPAFQADSLAPDSVKKDSLRTDSLRADSLRVDSLRRARRDSLLLPPIRLGSDTLPIRLPALETISPIYRKAAAEIAAARATALQLNRRAVIEAAWGQINAQTFGSATPAPALPGDVTPRAKREPSKAEQLFANYADLGIQFDGRFELRAEKSETNRCQTYSVFSRNVACRSAFEPLMDFQYSVRSGGVVADRLHVNIDYDSQREFDASNTINIAYEGTRSQFLQRFEIGNVTFQPPPSRFITANIPSGNYGLQAVAKLGDMRLSTILAQQKGNVVRDRVFTVGDQVLQSVDRTVEDYQFEPRRFFFTVDPTLLPGYPNIDIVNRQQMLRLSRSLPDTLRPVRLFVYRLLIGGQPATPNGPQFSLIGDPQSRRGPVYELLREGIDYYVDPSLLWICLVRPLSLNNERLVVAYRVRLNGVETTYPSTGGTPDLEYEPSRPQLANLVWDPQVKPGDPAFNREIRSVYRIGSNDVVRQSVSVKVVTGTGTDQEKPLDGRADTFLELFGLAQSTNSSSFDVENRVWPRATDANFSFGVGAFGQQTIRDRFLVFPSVRPFASGGLAGPVNPRNDTVYTTPGEYLNTSLRPPSVYHLKLKYQSQGNGTGGTLLLGAVQVRPNSERIVVDNIPLTRGTDYTVDYDLGRVLFARPDTLFPRPRQVVVQFEENPLFAETPTSIFGAALEIPLANGQLNFIGLSQSQRTSFTRPTLGYEPQATLIGGVNALMTFDAAPLKRLVSKLPAGETQAPSRVTVSAEFAASKPQPNSGQQAYLDSFESEGGLSVTLNDQFWYFSSQPAMGSVLASRIGANGLDLDRASTMAWQGNVIDERTQQQLRFSIEQIDPQSTLIGAGVASPEQIMWLTLYPLSIGGLRQPNGDYDWQTGVTLPGRRWRSIRTPLGPSGSDVSRAENIEFWALIHTSALTRDRNPTLVLDVGDISENSVAFSPDSITVRQTPLGRDTTFSGKQFQGLDQLNSERDPFSRTFNAGVNDIGLPGDIASNVTVYSDTIPGQPPMVRHNATFTTCRAGLGRLYVFGDARANCTAANGRLDDEDIDNDNVLNYTTAQRNSEQWRRYVVDLTDEQRYTRIGKCVAASVLDPTAAPTDSACWVYFRVPFRAPDDSLNSPSLRRARALRLTLVSANGLPDAAFSRIAIDRLRFTGAPWFKRSDAVLHGIGGEDPSGGFVVVGTVGTQDKNVRNGVDYESPPGVTDVADSKVPVGASRIQVNERSLRMTAGGIQQFERAEAYYRFPEGQKNFMGYKELRVWARGVSNGWGDDGELEFFIKIGRDASNFYMYRTPLNGGLGKAAWLPEIRLDFTRFVALRAKIQNAYLRGGVRNSCTGLDSALIANTPLPAGVLPSARYAACDDGYIVYTLDPAVSPPNLAAVQELAVGMVRTAVGIGSSPIAPSDTLELWVDDVRLGGVVSAAGFAGQVGVGVIAGDFADVRATISRRDPNFRQLGDQPTYVTDNGIDISAAFHLEKLFPATLGYSMPVSMSYTMASIDPTFLTQSDIDADAVPGLRTPRQSAVTLSFAMRRATPTGYGGILGAVVDNLALRTSYTTANARTEYQDGNAHDFRLGLEYNLSRALEGPTRGTSRWLPMDLILTSTYERGRDRRFSFLKPADAPDDTPDIVASESNTLRNGGVIGFRPIDGASFRVNLATLRDLRHYQRNTALAGATDAERERQVGTQLDLTRPIFPWLRARLNASTSFDMVRDPNTLTLLAADTLGDSIIPRRLANTQSTVAGLTLDVPALLRTGKINGAWRNVLSVFQPVDVTVDRSILTAYDGTMADASLGYQFALGSLGQFRRMDGESATNAGISTQVVISQNFTLPFGAVITNRYQLLTLRNWMRQLGDTQIMGDGTQLNFPDVSLRWSTRIKSPGALLTAFSATARAVGTKQLISSPTDSILVTAASGALRTRTYPFSLSATWAGDRPLTTTVGATFTERLEDRPGISGRGNGMDMSADIARAFALPQDWHARSDLRTRVSFQNSRGRSYVLNPLAVGRTSVLANNGRRALSFTADTDVAENLVSSFVLSRVSSFDRNFNRRFTQTVISAVLHMQFYAGEMK